MHCLSFRTNSVCASFVRRTNNTSTLFCLTDKARGIAPQHVENHEKRLEARASDYLQREKTFRAREIAYDTIAVPRKLDDLARDVSVAHSCEFVAIRGGTARKETSST